MERTTLWQMLATAGWTMIPLYICSLAALAVAIRTGIQFAMHKVGSRTVLGAMLTPLAQGDLGEVQRIGEADASPLGRVVASAASQAPNGADLAEAEASRVAMAELDRYEAWLPWLSFIAQVAPLFGLLGTVLGMVELFGSMEVAGSELSTATLSGGIWKALLTTAAGLIIAIPTLGAHLWFTRRVRALQHAMETAVGRVLDRVRGEDRAQVAK